MLKVIVFLSSLYAETSSPSLFVVLSSSRGKWSLRSDVAKGGSGSLVLHRLEDILGDLWSLSLRVQMWASALCCCAPWVDRMATISRLLCWDTIGCCANEEQAEGGG